jgi:pyridoxamine 5'-phosphate oxidase
MDTFATLENAAAAPQNPYPLFGLWMEEAAKKEPNDPNAMALATIDPDGRPSLRIVLLKGVDENGFVFFTNRESRKGQAIASHPDVALCFHWKSLGRQVRITGRAGIIADEESDAYYNTRPQGSRVGAWASLQSRPLETRSALAARVAEVEKRFTADQAILRPPHWGGYRVVPDSIEFWHDGLHRLHTRVLYTKTADGWARQMLYP